MHHPQGMPLKGIVGEDIFCLNVKLTNAPHQKVTVERLLTASRKSMLSLRSPLFSAAFQLEERGIVLVGSKLLSINYDHWIDKLVGRGGG